MARGTVKWFSEEKGYGFITPDDGEEDLFVYYTGIEGTGFRSLTEGFGSAMSRPGAGGASRPRTCARWSRSYLRPRPASVVASASPAGSSERCHHGRGRGSGPQLGA